MFLSAFKFAPISTNFRFSLRPFPPSTAKPSVVILKVESIFKAFNVPVVKNVPAKISILLPIPKTEILASAPMFNTFPAFKLIALSAFRVTAFIDTSFSIGFVVPIFIFVSDFRAIFCPFKASKDRLYIFISPLVSTNNEPARFISPCSDTLPVVLISIS